MSMSGKVVSMSRLATSLSNALSRSVLDHTGIPGDFDFNVVIRSLLYNQADHYLSWFAGSGITFNSDPEKEYEECLVKVAAFEKILKSPAG